MKVFANQALVSAAFRKLAALTRIEVVLDRVHTVEELAEQFNALPWDDKVFTLTDNGGIVWIADVDKEGPTLTLTPNRPDLEGLLRLTKLVFWKEFVNAIQAEHPAFRPLQVESFFERLFSDHFSETRRRELANHRHENETLNQHRRQLREIQRQKTEHWREAKADEHRYQYWLWYQ